jgi:uncharacterized protein
MEFCCPICKKSVDAPRDEGQAAGPPHFPFCSERCKLIDLGRWLDGKYQIPVAPDDRDEADQENP